jgi:NTP pyrophosphatase (non-canonical NTP hydrolase)
VLTITELCEESHRISKEHGFWALYDMIAEDNNSLKAVIVDSKLMLIVGEVAEAEDAIRHNKPKVEFAEELADIMIRVADLAEKLNIDLEEAIVAKTEKNKLRPYLHAKVF